MCVEIGMESVLANDMEMRNSELEIRNSKRIRIPKFEGRAELIFSLQIFYLNFGLVSDFDI